MNGINIVGTIIGLLLWCYFGQIGVQKYKGEAPLDACIVAIRFSFDRIDDQARIVTDDQVWIKMLDNQSALVLSLQASVYSIDQGEDNNSQVAASFQIEHLLVPTTYLAPTSYSDSINNYTQATMNHQSWLHNQASDYLEQVRRRSPRSYERLLGSTYKHPFIRLLSSYLTGSAYILSLSATSKPGQQVTIVSVKIVVGKVSTKAAILIERCQQKKIRKTRSQHPQKIYTHAKECHLSNNI